MVVLRILEGTDQSPEGTLRARLSRLNATLSRSEKILSTALERERMGDTGGARILKRRSREEARMAMRLIGILMIEFGMDMGPAIVRARQIVLATRNGSGAHAEELRR